MAPFFRQTPSGQAKRIGLTTTAPAPTTSREYVIPIGTIRGYRAYTLPIQSPPTFTEFTLLARADVSQASFVRLTGFR